MPGAIIFVTANKAGGDVRPDAPEGGISGAVYFGIAVCFGYSVKTSSQEY